MTKAQDLVSKMDSLLAKCNKYTQEIGAAPKSSQECINAIELLLKEFHNDIYENMPTDEEIDSWQDESERKAYHQSYVNLKNVVDDSLRPQLSQAKRDVLNDLFKQAIQHIDEHIRQLEVPFSDKATIFTYYKANIRKLASPLHDQEITLKKKQQEIIELYTTLTSDHALALEEAKNARTTFIQQFQDPGANKADLLEKYAENKAKKPFISKDLIHTDEKPLQKLDAKITRLIKEYETAQATAALNTELDVALKLLDEIESGLGSQETDKDELIKKYRSRPAYSKTLEESITAGAALGKKEESIECIIAAVAARKELIATLASESDIKAQKIEAYTQGKAPYQTTDLSDAGRKALAPLDKEISKLIEKYNTACTMETARRTKKMDEKTKPALTAMKKKVADLATKVKEARTRLHKNPDMKLHLQLADASVAHEAALKIYTKFNALYQQYIGLKIDLASFKSEAEKVVKETKWEPHLNEKAADVLAKHRGHQGNRSFKQMVHEFLKGLGLTSAAQYFFSTASTKAVEGFVSAVKNENDAGNKPKQ